MTAEPGQLERRARQAGRLRGFTRAEGILMLVLGVLALVFPVVASAWVTVMVALAFLVGGIVGWVNNLARARSLSRWHCFWRLVVSTLFLVAGLWMLLQFKAGLIPAALQVKALATAVGIVFLAEGAVMAIVSLSNRSTAGWAWGLVNGLVTLVLGLLILSMGPAGLLQVVGLLVGISFLFSGFDLLRFSARFHHEGE
ncbi:DUF308 domain-containing protein [Synechococcus sp. Tobar12-5m-g]|uniref:HdeD family acid-resistance protein n=1 Tax=unclassified Synechococcus TaxID=2626047 RepID=UPI0020CD3850|nr:MULTISPECIES: DUF308 domain-containing protein [unclassified Synechococcus]MCP9772688.1 DUF308 domain-containing protein [Synechococcus sp. Tobar12-5m-g]MCP9873456.1 DUF308 domain-containing protein [Synechococcus sp. Cruz CV-v-12]